MKVAFKFRLIFCILFCIGFCCKKIQQIPPKETFFTGKILLYSCGGTVIQFLTPDSLVGETWENFFSTQKVTYTNCALVGNFPMDKFHEGDSIGFNFEKVNYFKTGIFCDIGGLPKTKIEISDVVIINN